MKFVFYIIYYSFFLMDISSKHARYQRLNKQIKELLINSKELIPQLATINAVLYHKMKDFFWVGFYLLHNEELIVGPYQGPVACQELNRNTGVCWNSINTNKTTIVDDVHQFPGHIACDSRSKSEITIPLKDKHDKIIGVLDIDSKELNNFDEIDASELEKILSLINF